MLTELLIAVSIATVVLAGVTSSYMFMFRSSISMGYYAEMNDQSRRGLVRFGRDVRMATDVTMADGERFVVEIASASGTRKIEYRYDSEKKQLVRIEDGWTLVMLQDVEVVNFVYYNILGAETSTPIEIKKVQFDAFMSRSVLQTDTTNRIVSARFMMRNKRVAT